MIAIHTTFPNLRSRCLRMLSWLVILSLIINLLPPVTWANSSHVASRAYHTMPTWHISTQDAPLLPSCADIVPPTPAATPTVTSATATPLPTIAPTAENRTETPTAGPAPTQVAPMPEEKPALATLYLPVAMRQSAALDAAASGTTVLVDGFQAASVLPNVDCRVTLDEDTNTQVHLVPLIAGLGSTAQQFGLLSAPQFATAQVVDGWLHYTPNPNFYGVDQLIWRAWTADGQQMTGAIELHVHPVNDAPVVALHAEPVAGEAPLVVNFAANASDVDGDTLTYAWDWGDGASAVGVDTATHVYAQPGAYTATVTVSDGLIDVATQVAIQVASAPPTPEPTATTSVNRPPSLNLAVEPPVGTAPLSVQLSTNAADPDGDVLSYTWDFGDGVQAYDVPSTTHVYNQTGIFTATVTVSDGRGGTAAAWRTIVVDDGVPVLAAAPIDQTAPTVFKAATEFLYAGDYPVQKELAPATIAPKQAAVVRGRVLAPDGAPLRGARITIHQHPELGYTLSRDDGQFDLAVNGGGLLTVQFDKDGHLPVQRQVYVAWQDFTTLDDVVLTPLDPVVNAIDLNADIPMQTARGSLVSDADGSRQSTLLIPQGVRAELVLPGGITQTLTTLHIRATEYTVGELGPNAMPGNLPPESGYTYAVELSVDEAISAGATQVRFSQPLYHYVENFLNFPVGMAVPSGYYDRERVAWMPDADGRVVQIMGIADGLAQLDTIGDGAADNDSTLGITDAERAQLASLYTAGATLWRVPIRHFTPWDHNWPFGPPWNAIWPFGQGPSYDNAPDQPCEVDGSIIECESQVVGQRLALTGIPFTLNYRSDRTPARTGYFELPISGAELPDSLKEIQVYAEVAGVVISQTLPAQPNQSFAYQWDGRDVYGRRVQGQRAANIRLRYVYDGVYTEPNSASTSDGAGFVTDCAFGHPSDVVIAGSRTRQEIWLERTFTILLGAWQAEGQGLGGWSLDAHHVYDVNGQTLYQGDGSRRSVEAVDYVVTTVAGVAGRSGFRGDGGSALQAYLHAPNDVAIAADGAIYISDTLNCRIRRVDTDGIITTIAGTGECAYGGDGGLALTARLNKQQAIALAPDGALYVADVLNHRIRRFGPDGIMTTVAGTGAAGYNGDNIPAIQAKINYVGGLAVGPDGSLYIADTSNNRIRRVGPDGMITTVAGTGGVGYSGDGGPAAQARLWAPKDVAIGPDGSLYIADWYNHRVRRVTPDGIITTVAGNGARFYAGDGGAATETAVGGPYDVEVDGAGRLFILHKGFNIISSEDDRIRLVDQAGVIRTLAGGFPNMNPLVDGEPAAAVTLNIPRGMTLGPDGALYYADYLYDRIHRLDSPLAGFTGFDFVQPSADGSHLYHFDASGRHLRTLHARTGALRYAFGYDGVGRLATITDGDGNVTTIEHDAAGQPTAIVGSFGQRTTLSVDANGYLASLTNPAGETTRFTYTSDGLLTSLTDPLGHGSAYTYDDRGRLLSATNPVGGVQHFSRTETTAGYVVTRTNALGHVTSHPVTNAATGAIAQGLETPSGAQSNSEQQPDGVIVQTDARGITTRTTLHPDPRWGMAAPYVGHLTSETPDGHIFFTMTATRTVELADSTDPLSLLRQQDEIVTNGRRTTTVYDAASNTMTSTDPASIISLTTLDAQGRPLQVQTTGLAPLFYSYDGAGRLVQVQEGDGADVRTTTLQYDAHGYLQSRTDALGHVTSYAYDVVGRLTGQTLPTGHQLTFAYDAAGRLTESRDPRGIRTHYEYDAAGRLTAQAADADGRNVRSEFVYDALGNLLVSTEDVGGIGRTTSYSYLPFDGQGYLVSQVIDPLGALTTFAYAPTGDLRSVTDSLGRTTSYDYSPQGWLTQVTSPGGLSVQTTYNDEGQPVRVTDPRGGVTLYAYDELGRLQSSTAAAAPVGASPALTLTTQYVYDGLGRPTRIIDPAGQVSQQSYDLFGRLLSQRDPLGNLATFRYDKLDQLVEQVVGANNPAEAVTTQYEYDVLGRRARSTLDPNGLHLTTEYRYSRAGSIDTWSLQEVVDPKGAVTAYGYSSLGQQDLVTDALGQNWTFAYDNLGRLISQTDPLGHTVSYSIDKLDRTVALTQDGRTESWQFALDGSLTTYTDFAGQTTHFIYDVDQRLTQVDYPASNADASYVYDAAGNVTRMSDSLGVTSYGYDAAGRLQSRTRNGKTVAYSYASNSQVSAIDYWGRGAVSYGYDGAGQLTSLTPWGQPAASYSYRSTGMLANQSRGNGVSTTYGYDSASRLTRLLHATGGGTLQDIQYVLDANGNRTQMSDGDGLTTYAYDALNRLTQVELPAMPTGPPAQTITYGLDAVGNRTSDNVATYTYDASDRLTNAGFSYDANGNLLSDDQKQYQYDGANRLTRVISGTLTVEYGYDGWGNLVLEQSGGITTEFVLDELSPLPLLLGEVRSDGVERLYAYGPDGFAVQRTLTLGGGDEVAYPLLDGLGSVRHLTDAVGAVTLSRSYDAFGALRYESGSGITRLGFTGQLADPNTGLIYLRARHYHPVLGRFLQRDTFAGFVGRGQSLNRYTYTENNPVNLTDPSGHCPWCVAAGAGAVIGAGTEYGFQVYQNYQNGVRGGAMFTQNLNWRRIGMSAVGGAVGGLAGFGLGSVLGGVGGRLGSSMAGRVALGFVEGGLSDVASRIAMNAFMGCAWNDGLWSAFIGGGLGGGAGAVIGAVWRTLTKELHLVGVSKAITHRVLPTFYVSPRGEAFPATAYRYSDSRYFHDIISTGGSPGLPRGGHYIGFEAIDSARQVQNRFQISAEWSDARVRGRFDTLQLYEAATGQWNARIPNSLGDTTLTPEPFTTSYPEFGEGGAQQYLTYPSIPLIYDAIEWLRR